MIFLISLFLILDSPDCQSVVWNKKPLERAVEQSPIEDFVIRS